MCARLHLCILEVVFSSPLTHTLIFSSLPLPSQTALASTRKNDSKIVQEKADEKMAPDIDASGATAGLLSAPETACESESCSA